MCLLLNKSTSSIPEPIIFVQWPWLAISKKQTKKNMKKLINSWISLFGQTGGILPISSLPTNKICFFMFLCQCILPLGLLDIGISTNCSIFSLPSWPVGIKKPLWDFNLAGFHYKHITKEALPLVLLHYQWPKQKNILGHNWAWFTFLAATWNDFTSISVKYSQILVISS